MPLDLLMQPDELIIVASQPLQTQDQGLLPVFPGRLDGGARSF
jgi:hypothetical protein